MDRVRRPGHRDVGRGGWLLLRRAAVARRHATAAEGPLDGRPASAVRGHGVRREVPRAASGSSSSASGRSSQSATGTDRRSSTIRSSSAIAAGGWLDPRRDETSPGAGHDARRERVLEPATASARSRAITCDHPFVFDVGGQEYRVPICRPNRIPACSAATPTGADRSGCRSTR